MVCCSNVKPEGKGWGSETSEPAQGGSPGCGLRETRRGEEGGACVRKPYPQVTVNERGGEAERVKPPWVTSGPFQGDHAQLPSPFLHQGEWVCEPGGGLPPVSPHTVISDIQPAGL